LLGELRLLDDFGKSVRDRKIATKYLSQRLLGTQTYVSPRLDNIRQIAWQLTLDDANGKDGYIDTIKSLSLLVGRRKAVNMREWFQDALPSGYQDHGRDCDLTIASICTGRLITFRKLIEKKELMLVDGRLGLLGDPYIAAACVDDFAVIDHLLCQHKKQGLDPYRLKDIVIHRIFPAACEFASPKTIETLLASPWCSFLRIGPGRYSGFQLQRQLATPNLDTFDVIQRFVNTPCNKGLGTLLWTAAGRGWEEMAHRLLELGALADDDLVYKHYRNYQVSKSQEPLFSACRTGSWRTVTYLLQYNAKVESCEVGDAAKRGQFGMVKALVEHGAAVDQQDASTILPIVSAVLLEHTEMFQFLLERSALHKSDFIATIQKAREHELESMIELLETSLVNR